MSSIPTRIQTTFHADLSDAYPGEDYWVRANNANHPLKPHTADSRARARAAEPALCKVPDERLTHYTDQVSMPTGKVMRVHIKHTARNIPGIDAPAVPGHTAIYVPPSAQELARTGGSGGAHVHIDPVSTAKTLSFHHPDLITESPQIAAIIKGYMDNNQAIAHEFETLGTLIRDMGKPSTTPGAGWATLDPFTARANPETGEPGVKSFFLNPSSIYMTAAGKAQTSMMLVTKNDMQLQGIKWGIQYGSSVSSTTTPPPPAPPARPPLPPAPAPAPAPVPAPASGAQAVAGASPNTVATVQASTTGEDWTVALTNTQRVNGLQVSLSDVDASTQQFTITFSDNYLRYLGYYVRFFDAEGNTIDLTNWTPVGDDSVTSLTYDLRKAMGPLIEYDDIQFIGYTSGATTVLGIPTFDGQLSVTFVMPPGAVSAEVFGSGLGLAGSDTWWKTPMFGGALTVLLNLVVPAVMLAGAASQLSNASTKAEVDKLLNDKWKFAVPQLIYYLGDCLEGVVVDRTINWADLVSAAKVLFQPLSFKLLLFIEAEMAIEEAAEEVPFAGWVLFALNLSVGIATMAETIVEICTTPWNIPVGLTSTITSNVSVNPDPRHGAFPQAQPGSTSSLMVRMIYKGQKRQTVFSSQVVPATTPSVLTAAFPNNTLGGQIKVEAVYYIDNWQAAQASTGWMKNDETHASDITLYLVQNPIPLDASSIYAHTSILTYQNNQYQWQPTATAPTATLANSDTSTSGNAISLWEGLALSQRYGSLGFAWKAAGMGIVSCSSQASGQLYAMQNIDIPGTPMIGAAFPGCGFVAPTRMVYDPYPPKFLMYNNEWVLNPVTQQPLPDPFDVSLGDYYIDPSAADVAAAQGGGYHLRQIVLGGDSVTINTSPGQLSWGRFAYYPDSICIHPSGNVVAVNTANAKLSITTLQTEGAADDAVPMATAFGGTAQTEGRAGLLFTPVAVSCSYDGTVLVLENTKGGSSGLATIPAVARIQAFDINGNPVNRFFDANGAPTPFLPLQGVGDYTYLDMSVVGDEQMTYMYLLYYTGSGQAPGDYNVAIYQYGTSAPDANPLVTTQGVAASNLFVDMWHTLYTLNYAMVTNGNGAPAGPAGANTGPAGRTVPSVSEWLPPVPTSDA